MLPLPQGIHEFEYSCPPCTVDRQVNPLVTRQCSVPDCNSNSVLDVATSSIKTLREHSCNSTCTSKECMAAYDAIFSIHDKCPGSEDREVGHILAGGIHAYEVPCATSVCNTGDGGNDLECSPQDASLSAHTLSSLSLVGVTTVVVLLLLAVAALRLYLSHGHVRYSYYPVTTTHAASPTSKTLPSPVKMEMEMDCVMSGEGERQDGAHILHQQV